MNLLFNGARVFQAANWDLVFKTMGCAWKIKQILLYTDLEGNDVNLKLSYSMITYPINKKVCINV